LKNAEQKVKMLTSDNGDTEDLDAEEDG